MGKLLIIFLILILVLVILPNDLKNWCMMQLENLMAGLIENGHSDMTLATAEVAQDSWPVFACLTQI